MRPLLRVKRPVHLRGDLSVGNPPVHRGKHDVVGFIVHGEGQEADSNINALKLEKRQDYQDSLGEVTKLIPTCPSLRLSYFLLSKLSNSF